MRDEACRRLESTGSAQRAIASTDGDGTQVAERWLLHTLQAVKAGADAVGGRNFTDAFELPAVPACACVGSTTLTHCCAPAWPAG